MFGVAMETGGKQVLSPESAAASGIYDQFVTAQTFKSVLGTFRLLCDTLRIKPTNFPNFYPKLKAKLRSWKVQALWAKFEKRASHKCYNRGKTCANTKVLIIGAGPCGLRAAIEAQLLGAKVVVIEKRDRFSRNNVLHLWPFVIHDLRNLGAKKFYGKFCAGTIDHISIRQLQCVLLKVALLLGVEVHENVVFDDLIEPPLDQSQEKIGWRPLLTPRDHPVSQYEFDVVIGADGKRNTLTAFKRKEFRGKLAIAITANFINRRSEAEARVQEISGVAFIFNQKFFQDLKEYTGIDLENIVYYKDETHYFVMTAKKTSLIEKGVILNDYSETERLLSLENVNREALLEYAREAADFSTNFQMPNLDFAVNHYGQADVAMFDFTSMFAAESACRIVELRGHKLLQCLVGDSLLEPFWPTGSGCARGFLSSMDACWMIRSFSLGMMTPLQVLAERESAYRLLAQTTHENLNKDFDEYSLNPSSRYPNLNLNAVRPAQVKNLYTTDRDIKDEPIENYELPKKRKKKDSFISSDALLNWCQRQVILYKNIRVENMTSSWKNGMVLCSIIHRYRPDLIDFNLLDEANCECNIQIAFDVCEREYGILPVMTAKEMADVPDALSIVAYVSQIYDVFRGQIPHIARAPLADISPEDRPASPNRKMPTGRLSLLSRIGQRLTQRKRYSVERNEQDKNLEVDVERELNELRRAKKRRSLERDRALFILNKDGKQPVLTGMKKLEPSFEDREQFSSRVKDLEEKLYGAAPRRSPQPVPKKVGKISQSDWNVKMLEEKLKGTKPDVKKDREEVPKWSRDIFEEKLRTMDSKSKNEGDDEPVKYIDFDSNLKMLDKKLKEGNNLETGQRGMNKVSAMAEQISGGKITRPDSLPLQKLNSNVKSNALNLQQGSESCYFCQKRVYLMERHSANGKFFHRGCFKCECCHIALRLGNYGVGIEEPYIGKFLCLHHFSMRTPPKKRPTPSSEIENKKVAHVVPTKVNVAMATPKTKLLGVHDGRPSKYTGLTPERVEFENTLDLTSEEELLSEIDEDEWTDRNFGMSANEYESTESESEFSSEEMTDEEREELEKAYNKSFVGKAALSENLKKWFTKSDKSKKVGNEEEEDEETDEEYDESDEEYSYEEYENEDGESTPTEGEPRQGGGEGPSDKANNAAKNNESNGEIVSQPLAQVDGVWNNEEYKTLKSNDETCSEELHSNSSDSDDYTDESETETDSANGDDELDADEIDEDLNRSKHRHEIPSIVIDVTTVNAPNEEDDSYFETLQQQSLNAEKTLENLIRGQGESVPETPSTPTEFYAVVEEMHPLVRPSPSQELIQVSELLNEHNIDEIDHNNEESITPIIEDKSAKLEEVDKVRSFRTLPKDLGRNKRPISLIDTTDKFDVSDKKFGSVVDINREKQFTDEERIIKKVDSVSSFGKRKSSLESASSLPDLEKSKPVDKENIGSGNKLTESPTAKMMLKLKERYLLGSSNEPEILSTVAEPPTKIEPVVKSLLDLISEKQKMLTPATSPSPLQQTRSFNYNESSPSPTSLYLSSNSSTPSFSDPSRVALTGFSMWAAKQSPVTTTVIVNKPLTELGKNSTKDKVDDVVNCDKNEVEETRKESPDETAIASSKLDMNDEVIDVPVAGVTNCDPVEFNSEIQPDNSAGNLVVVDIACEKSNSVEDLTLAAIPCLVEETETNNKSDNEFSHINDSNITIRSRRKRSSGGSSDDLSSLVPDSKLEELNNEPSLIKQEEAVASEEEAPNEKILLGDDINVKELVTVNELEKIKEDGSIHGDDDIAEMLSNSESSSDSTPSLDESIYHPPAAQPKLMQQQFAAYVGSLASRGITFGGVRDSIDIRKSALKRSPIKMGIGHSLLLSAAKNDTSLQTQPIAQPIHIEESMPSDVAPDKDEIKNSSKMMSDLMTNEEIPFADEESSSQDSEKNVKKKKPLRYTPSTPVKRPTFERPISMIEMRSFSFPSLAPKNDHSPDTPLSEGHGYSTPSRNREEVIDDLRQLRTVEREKARQLARERARLKSDEELGIKGLDYSKLRRKYQKSDDSPNIREEGNYILADLSTSEETPCDEEDVVEGEDLINHIEIPLSPNLDADIVEDKIGSGLPESSSPDSDVFERCSPILATEIEESKDLLSNEVLAVEDEPEKLIDQYNPAEESTPLKSESESSNTTEPSKSEEIATKISESSESAVFECTIDTNDAIGTGTGSSEDQILSGTSTNSKTDCASYLEPDLSIRDLKSNQFSPEEIPNKVTDKSDADNGVKSKSNSLPGLLSKKDKTKKKSTSPPPIVEKQKSKDKKGGLLSLFSSLSKSKDRDERDHKKEKSPSPPLVSSSTSQSTTTVATEVPLQGAGIKVDGTPKESRFHKLKLSRSKDKVKDKRKQKSQSVDSPSEITRPTSTLLSPSVLATTSQGLSLTPDQMKPKKYILGIGDKAAEITLDKHALLASMAFISKSASTAKVSNGTAPQASEDSFSDIDDESSQTSPGTMIEISEERRRKYEKMMLREQRLQEQKRLRGAQEIQRQLEELDVKQRSLELRGVEIEKALRGEGSGSDENRKEQELLQEWLYLMQTKNNLIRHEHELMVKAKELELEDRHARLKARLYKLMQIEDSKKTDEQLEEEGKLLSEAYEIVNQRDNLIMLLEESKCLEEEPNLM